MNERTKKKTNETNFKVINMTTNHPYFFGIIVVVGNGARYQPCLSSGFFSRVNSCLAAVWLIPDINHAIAGFQMYVSFVLVNGFPKRRWLHRFTNHAL